MPESQEIEETEFPQQRACPFDLPEAYGTLRAEAPLSQVRLPSGMLCWLLTRYEDVRSVLDDPRFSADPGQPGYPMLYKQRTESVLKGTFARTDGAEHMRYRRILGKEFTYRRADAMRQPIVEIVDGLLDRMEAEGPPADLLQSVGYPLASTVICRILGVPYEDHEHFEQRTRVMISGKSTPQQVMGAKDEMLEYLDELVDRKMAEPGDDMIGRLIVEHVRPGALTREEVVTIGWLLLAAGHDTTANMISLGTMALLEHPTQLDAVRERPDLIPGAVEELLRHQTIMQIGMLRVALEDVELHGRVIRAGDGIVANLAAANRDGAAFPEGEQLDVTRRPKAHVAFGYGPHQCLGQSLARVELQVTFDRLLHRFPGLRLGVGLDDVPFRHFMYGLYGPLEVPVVW